MMNKITYDLFTFPVSEYLVPNHREFNFTRSLTYNGTMTHLNINDDTVLHGTPRDAYHTSTFIEDTVVGGILSQQPDELGSPV